jgi:hypothetical protein
MMPWEWHLVQLLAAYLTISCISTQCHCGNLANPGPLGMIADVREVASILGYTCNLF